MKRYGLNGKIMNFYVEIINHKTQEIEKKMGPFSERKANQIYNGVNINLNHDKFYTIIAKDMGTSKLPYDPAGPAYREAERKAVKANGGKKAFERFVGTVKIGRKIGTRMSIKVKTPKECDKEDTRCAFILKFPDRKHDLGTDPDDLWCYGCNYYVCGECDRPEGVTGPGHDLDEHIY